MDAAWIDSPGSASSIRVGKLPIPRPGPGQVRIRVEASPVNHVDTFVRSGAYRTALEFPFVVGRDAVGVVDACGPDVHVPAPGDRVWCNSLGHAGRQGTAAEFAVADAARVYRLPGGANPVQASAVLHAGATAFLGLIVHGRLSRGDTAFIGGGAGQVGSAAVTIAAHAGARVLTSASAADLDYCRSLGAEKAVDYHGGVEPATLAPDGVDVVLDTSGAGSVQDGVDALAPRGRIVLLAGLGTQHRFTAGTLYTKDASITGFAISNARVDELARAADCVNELIDAGKLTARRVRTVPLAGAADAHAALEDGSARGEKIVLIP